MCMVGEREEGGERETEGGGRGEREEGGGRETEGGEIEGGGEGDRGRGTKKRMVIIDEMT